MESGIAVYSSRDLELFNESIWFDRVEIPGEMLDEPDLLSKFLARQKICMQVRELLPRNVLSGLPEASVRVLRDFLKVFEDRCNVMSECGITVAALTPDLSRAANDAGYAAKLQDILLCMRGIGSRYGIEFFYELRLPESFENALEITRKFLNSNTLASRLLIDFHPHEPKGFELLPLAVEKLPFQRDAWRLSFEVASCNYLSMEAVKRTAENSRKMRFQNEFMIFAPGNGADAENFYQLNMLAKSCFAEPTAVKL